MFMFRSMAWGAVETGGLRTTANVQVRTRFGPYTPPVPDAGVLSGWLRDATDGGGPSLRRASSLFARTAKAQPFGDGNKRTALLAANGLLLRDHVNAMLAVSVEEPDLTIFNDLLGRWYMDDDPRVIRWLEEWNLTNPED